MENLFVIDRIIGEIVLLENLATKEIFEVKKSQVVGDCIESSVYVKTLDKYVYSEIETQKRNVYIKDLSKSLFN